MDPAALSARLSELRDTGPTALLLRVAVLVGCLVALGAVVAAPWDAPDAFVVLGLLTTAGCVGLPDSVLPLVFSVCVVGSVATRSDGDIDARVVVAAMALLVVHVGCALAAAAPLPSTIDTAVVRRWAWPTIVLAGSTLAAAGVLAGLTSWGPAGSVGVTIGALAMIVALALRWSSEP